MPTKETQQPMYNQNFFPFYQIVASFHTEKKNVDIARKLVIQLSFPEEAKGIYAVGEKLKYFLHSPCTV